MNIRRGGFRMAMAAAALLVTAILARPAFAVDVVDDPVQIDERAAQVQDAANSLCWEMYRFHQIQPNFREAYRSAKEIYNQAGAIRDGLRGGPMESGALAQQAAQISEAFSRLDQSLSQWGDGDRAQVPLAGAPTERVIATPGIGVNVPFVGVRVGRPRYYITEDGPPMLERIRLHPNSHGSKRSLERELAAVKVAVSYLMEDAGVTGETGQQSQPSQPATPGPRPSGAASTGPVPNPPDERPALGEPTKVVPPSARKTGNSTSPK